MKIFLQEKNAQGLSAQEIREALQQSLEGRTLRKALIIPPDFTRFYSNGGFITNVYYHLLVDMGCKVDILPALGTHFPLTGEQMNEMYGDIPHERFIAHNWRTDVQRLGEVPADYLAEISEGLWDEAVDVEVNRRLMDPSYDIVLSVGQVVPHEVVGMANHTKNIFVGVGGSDMINKSHMVGAVFGMERMMGKDLTPVRKMFDYAWKKYLAEVPLLFVLTVTTAPGGEIHTHGLFIGDQRDALESAVALAQQHNMDFLERSIPKCVVYLEPKEFHTTWVGNKAIYRTRMAIADGGELLVLAPGVHRFGEDDQNDAIIRKYGYCGRLNILELFRQNEDLRENMGVAAHLIHGSADGRFSVTYAVKDIPKEEIESVHLQAADYDEMAARYDPKKLAYGWNTMPDGEEIFFIPNPALGLWIDRNRFAES